MRVILIWGQGACQKLVRATRAASLHVLKKARFPGVLNWDGKRHHWLQGRRATLRFCGGRPAGLIAHPPLWPLQERVFSPSEVSVSVAVAVAVAVVRILLWWPVPENCICYLKTIYIYIYHFLFIPVPCSSCKFYLGSFLRPFKTNFVKSGSSQMNL